MQKLDPVDKDAGSRNKMSQLGNDAETALADTDSVASGDVSLQDLERHGANGRANPFFD